MSNVRLEILSRLQTELIGPHQDYEEIKEHPAGYYLTGVLYPEHTRIDPVEDDTSEVERGEQPDDPFDETLQVPLKMAFLPSSIGLTVMVRPGIDCLECEVTYGVYDRLTADNDTDVWKRVPVSSRFTIPVGQDGRGVRDLDRGGCVEWVVRSNNDCRYLTAFLRNRNSKPDETELRDEFCLFQPQIVLRSLDSKGVFLSRMLQSTPSDPDVRSFDLLYRDRLEFGVGHGCAVCWDGVNGSAAQTVYTSLIPTYEVPVVVHRDLFGLKCLEMEFLATCSDPGTLIGELHELASEYETWIEERQQEAELLAVPQFKAVAQDNIDRCRKALQRIRSGIDLLNDSQVRKAFQFANKAMLYQRSYSKWAAEYRRTGTRKSDKPVLEGKWRPFQLAFILMNMDGILPRI